MRKRACRDSKPSAGRIRAALTGEAPLLIQRIVKMLLTERPVPAAIDENFGTIFIVAGRKRPGHAVGIGGQPAITRSHCPRLMLAGITIKIFPQHRRKNKFRIDRRLQ